MISIEEKIQVFTQSLLNKERKNAKKIIDEAKIKQSVLIADSLKKREQEKKSIEERSVHTIFRDKNKILAQAKNKAKTLELEERNKILLDFNQFIHKKAKSYLTQEGYSDYLSDCIKSIPKVFGEKKQLIVSLNEQDLILIKTLFDQELNNYSVEYRQEINEKFGGIIVKDSDSRIYCDFTIENLIKTHYKRIGMILNEFMENKVV